MDDITSVRSYPGIGRYIPVNPMSDEAELLRSIGADPASCTKVDGYLSTGVDVYFVQVLSTTYERALPVGVYARKPSDDAGYAENYVVVVPDVTVATGVVERSLAAVRSLIDSAPVLGTTLRAL